MDRPKAKPPAGIWLRVIHLEHLFPIPVELYHIPVGNELHPLRFVRNQQARRVPEIILRPQRAQHGITHISPKPSRRIGIPPDAHIVSKELIVIRKLSRSLISKDILGTPRIAGHPEAIQIANPVIGAPLIHHSRLILDQHRPLDHRPKPNRGPRRHINAKSPPGGFHPAPALQLSRPPIKRLRKILGKKQLASSKSRDNRRRLVGIIRSGQGNRRQQRRQTDKGKSAKPDTTDGLALIHRRTNNQGFRSRSAVAAQIVANCPCRFPAARGLAR